MWMQNILYLQRSLMKKWTAKKRQNVSSSGISEFFTTKVPYKKEDAQ
jgi:hypothetical protein